jgi:GNAT superfamily N-acetyltransferase
MDWKTAVVPAASLSAADLKACLDVLDEGKAVDIEFAAAELPHALHVAVARVETTIVAVTAIKRARPHYASGISKKSGFEFRSDLPELGYAAVSKDHQGHDLGGRLVREILAQFGSSPLFATTSHPAMMKHLTRAGFARFGNSWPSKDGKELTLWLRK